MFNTIFKHKISYVIVGLYLLLFCWWLKIYFSGARETNENYLFGFLYAFIALIGGINGLVISKKWGSSKSFVGRGIIFFSLGLLGLWFGQTVWSYYNVIAKVEVPYPSIADIGFFSIIPLYILGILSFGKAVGAKFSLKTLSGKLTALILPFLMLVIAYYLFLKDLTPDLSQPLKTFFDFGYPLGEATAISLALLMYRLSQGVLGGKMKSRVLYIVFALVFHFITEYSFLYSAAAGSYYNAGIVDLMYATSFTIMSLGLIAFSSYED